MRCFSNLSQQTAFPTKFIAERYHACNKKVLVANVTFTSFDLDCNVPVLHSNLFGIITEHYKSYFSKPIKSCEFNTYDDFEGNDYDFKDGFHQSTNESFQLRSDERWGNVWM